MKLQKFLFIIAALAVICGAFYYLFVPDLKNAPIKLNIVVDKKGYADSENSPFLEDLRKEFSQKYNNISIKYIYIDDYKSIDYILGNNSVVAWFPNSEKNLEELKNHYSLKDRNDFELQTTTYATSPMVILGWKYKLNNLDGIDIAKLYDIVTNNRSWSSVGGNSQLGSIKFSHPNPTISDAGVRFIVLLTDNYLKTTGFTKGFITKFDVTNAKDYIMNFEKNIKYQAYEDKYAIDDLAGYNSKDKNIDMSLLNEYTILKDIKNAQTKWSDLKIIYPTPNISVNLPFTIVNPSKLTPEKADALNKFKEFLMSDDIQKKVLKTGYRPVNTNIQEMDSLEKQYSDFGFKKDIKTSTIGFDVDTDWSVKDLIYEMKKD